MLHINRRFTFFILLVCSVLFLLFGYSALLAGEPQQDELQDIWARVRQSGAYRYNAEVNQVRTPQASVANAGRKRLTSTLYMEGETDLHAESLYLTLWSNGGSVLAPESGVEIKVEGEQALVKTGTGTWEEIDDFTGIFAPDGDFMAYGHAAENVVRHEPEMLSTAAGKVQVTRYTFDINGQRFAEQMRTTMMEQAQREGLPAGITVETPRIYADMNGQGELWIGPDGLPLRQIFSLQFPPDAYNYTSTAEIQVDFFDFAPLSVGIGLDQWRRSLGEVGRAINNPHTVPSLLSIALAFLFVWLLLRRSKSVYPIVVLTIIASMLVTPLLTAQQLGAYSARQTAKQAAQEAQQAEIEANEAMQTQLATPAANPHDDPLARARQTEKDQELQDDASQDEPAGKYYDPLCASEPAGDEDNDGLTNLSECLVGTLVDVADSDQDGVSDADEVQGFEYKGQRWYTDPTTADTNADGIGDGKEWHMDADGNQIPDDTDGDGHPDIWDDDNDGDGVRDSLDLSPNFSGQNSQTFSGSNPFELAIDNLQQSELVRVEYQIRPTNPDNLWYSQSVLDWPVGDQQGQIQDFDDATFYDLDNTLDPWPNANGDMRLVPMLEITMPINSANLPPAETCTLDDGSTSTCYPPLEQFGIAIQQQDDDNLLAYVPLQLVNDGIGDANVAFYARMFYQASGSWAEAHESRLVWVVQVLNDICTTYENGICSEYDPEQTNQLQVVQTYDDEWFFTGLHVMEEHEADFALIYEDPQATNSFEAGYDRPFYMDTLYGLLYGLDSSFLAGRDCDTTATNGDCQGDGQLDVTVNTIGDRFNYTTNNYDANDPAYWGLPNVLGVVKNGIERQPGDAYGDYAAIPSYEAFDLGMLDTTSVQTKNLLDSTFTAAWSASDPITPTIMLAYQHIFRDLNLDTLVTNDPNLSWNGSSLTMNLPQSGDNQVAINTMAAVKWTPYAYDPAAGWAPAEIDAFYDALTAQLGTAFSDISDPTEAETQQKMAQFLYLTVNGGANNIVQRDDIILSYDYQQPDYTVVDDLAAHARYTASAVSGFISFSADLAVIAETFPEKVGASIVLKEYIQQNLLDELKGLKGLGYATLGALGLALITADLIVNYILKEQNTKAGQGLDTTVHVVFLLYTAYTIANQVKSAFQLANALKDLTEISFGRALLTTLSTSSSLVKATNIASVAGLIISVSVAIAVFVMAWASGSVSPGSIAFYELLAQTIAAIIVALVLYILSLFVIGAIIVGILGLIDAILTLFHKKTITGWVTKELSSVIYQYDLDTTQDIESGPFGVVLTNPDLGMIAGNGLQHTLPLTTTLTETPIASQNISYNSLIYELSIESKTLSTSTGDSEWFGTDSSHLYKVDYLTAQTTLAAGINSTVPLYLNSAYALLGESCWAPWLDICQPKTAYGSSSDSMDDSVVLDVLPATLEGLVDVGSWGDVRFLDADGDGMLAISDGGLDPDDTTWDIDKDALNDAYEITISGLSVDQGGASLDPTLPDTDGDSLGDYAELRNATDPGSRDSDGDGLWDGQETMVTNKNNKLVYNASSGWLIPYAYDSASQKTAVTRVWSNPLNRDFDNDGMSDLFEQSQTILDSDPWADPNDPLVFNPRVWNESPVALFVEDDSNDGFVLPGATVNYRTTTTNNLSSGQELVGELALGLPDGVSGSPLSQPVDIGSGESDSLISTLQFNGSASAEYVFSSSMNLTDFDKTVWAWDPDDPATFPAKYGTVEDVTVLPVFGWNAPFLMITRESKPDSKAQSGLIDTINAYLLSSDGSIVGHEELYNSEPDTNWTRPALACNNGGVCLVAWGTTNYSQRNLELARLDGSLKNGSILYSTVNVKNSTAVSVASDGTDFMLAIFDGSHLNVLPVAGVGQQGQTVSAATVSGSNEAAAIAWTGEQYTLVWTAGGTMSRADVDNNGSASNVTTIGSGSGWPQTGATDRAPALAYDAISKRTLLAYRDESGNIAARILTGDHTGEATLIAGSGVDGNNVIVSLSPDTKNSGWAAAWAVAGSNEVEYRAISPSGFVRGDIATVDRTALTAVALTCDRPHPMLELKLDEPSDATTFSDSSGNDHFVTCGSDAGSQCPAPGNAGLNGNAALFDGQSTALIVPNNIDLANRSFTLSAWAKRENVDKVGMIMSQGGDPTSNNRMYLGFYDNNAFVCAFEDNVSVTQQIYTDTDWHHWVCTYDAGTGQRLIYRDGVQVPAKHTGNSSGNYIGSGPLYIGRLVVPDWYFEGLLEDVKIYDRPLSAKEIGDVFDRPVGVFDLDEAAGSETFINAAGTGFNGTCSGSSCPTMGVQGISYSAAQFDGQDDTIEIVGSPESDKPYKWDFQASNPLLPPGWLEPEIAQAFRNSTPTQYLVGGNDKENDLRLANLPAHDTVKISYDLFVIGSDWTGTHPGVAGPPSDFIFNSQGANFETSFSNESSSTIGAYQLYPAEADSWDNMATTLYQNSNCSGQSFSAQANNGQMIGYEQLPQADFNTNCVQTNSNTVAFLYSGTNYEGTVYRQDPKRNYEEAVSNVRINSLIAGPAAYMPRHGSTGDSLVVNGNSDNSVYAMQSTFDHTASWLDVTFLVDQDYGLDNFTVELIKDANSFVLRNSSFTLSAWAKRDSSGQSHFILSQGSATQNEGLQFGFRPNDTFTCAFYDDDLNTTATYADTDWHHWVCTYDAQTKQRTIYRDGVQVAQDTAAANYSGFGSTYIGSGFGQGDNFSGTIDEVGIWTQALDEDEVQELHDKVKVEDQSVLICQLPVGNGSDELVMSTQELRETTTNIGAVSQTITRTITIDADKPTASITSPFFSSSQPGPYTASPGALVISGGADDPTSYITAVNIKNNNDSDWQSATGSEAWSFTWDTSALSDGPYTLQLRARDVVGNESNVTNWHTILDATPPSITINEASTAVLPRKNTEGVWHIVITGTVSDPPAGSQPGSGVTGLDVLLVGQDAAQGAGWQEATLNADGTWQVDYTLSDFNINGQAIADPSGDYKVTVRATDAAGNVTPQDAPATATLTLDATPPVVTAGADLANTLVISSGLTIGGPASDNDSLQAVEINFTPAEQIDALSGANLYLPMDELAGTVYFDDQSGSNNDAICSGGSCPTAGVQGKRSAGFQFDGEGEHIWETQSVVKLSKADFTIAVWINTTASKIGLVTKSNNNKTWEKGEKSFYLDENGVPSFVGFGNSYIHGTTAVNDGQWHHVVVTWDYSSGSSGDGRIYVDGRDDTNTSTSNYQDQNADVSGDLLRIGKANFGVEAPNFFKGTMDEFIVYQRALADYEVANLFAYGSGIWETASFNGGSWSYTVPAGEQGFEGYYQINVRGTDALGNVTQLGGQRVWRGEIDTRPPSVTFFIETDNSGAATSTTYSCQATDFNLVQDTTCNPGWSPPVPTFRIGDMTLTTYAETDLWFANTFTNTSRLYKIDADRTYTGNAVSGQTMIACDKYNHCREVDPATNPTAMIPAGAEVLNPSSGTALATSDPVLIEGDAFAGNGLQALMVTINNLPFHAQIWLPGEAHVSPWSFEWTPPGEGVYTISPLISDWSDTPFYKSYMPIFAVSEPVESSQNRQGKNEAEAIAENIAQGIDSFTNWNWPDTVGEVNDAYAGKPVTIYVDLQPPQITIAPTILGPDERVGRALLELTGSATDSLLLHRVDVSINGGPWQRAGLSGDDGWHFYWYLDNLPTMEEDKTFEIRARATDVAGRTTTVTETVIVKAP